MSNKISSLYSDILAGLIFMVAAISLSVMITLNFRPLFYHDIESLDICQESGLSEELIKENYDRLIDYNNFWGSKELEFNGLSSSEEGMIHFEEVKAIFVKLEYAAIICTLAFIATAVLKLKKKKFRFLLFGSIFTVVIPAVVGAVIAVNWDWAFITFHKLAFDNDYWIFDPAEDQVITMLPDAFFAHCAVMIVALSLLLAIVSAVVYLIFKRRNRNADKG